MRLSKETLIISGIGIVFIVVIGLLIWHSSALVGGPTGEVSDLSILVRPNSHMTASSTAKVTMVEFGDYQCPACGAVYPTLKAVTEMYKNNPDFNFVFRNFPLSQHQYAKVSAGAAEAAGAQGKYWEMHDMLYENQAAWDPEKTRDPISIFAGYAKQIGLDVNKFTNDLKNNTYSSVVDADLADANKLGLNHTPTLFINGKEQTNLAVNNLKSEIDAILAK